MAETVARGLLWLKPTISLQFLSLLTLLSACYAALGFFHPEFLIRIAGVIFLQVAVVVWYARQYIIEKRGAAMPLDNLFHGVAERVSEIMVIGSITHHLASHVSLPLGWTPIWILILGSSAALGLLLASYIRQSKKVLFDGSMQHLRDSFAIFVFSVSVAVIFQLEFWLLWGIGVASVILILKELWTAKRL